MPWITAWVLTEIPCCLDMNGAPRSSFRETAPRHNGSFSSSSNEPTDQRRLQSFMTELEKFLLGKPETSAGKLVFSYLECVDMEILMLAKVTIVDFLDKPLILSNIHARCWKLQWRRSGPFNCFHCWQRRRGCHRSESRKGQITCLAALHQSTRRPTWQGGSVGNLQPLLQGHDRPFQQRHVSSQSPQMPMQALAARQYQYTIWDTYFRARVIAFHP